MALTGTSGATASCWPVGEMPVMKIPRCLLPHPFVAWLRRCGVLAAVAFVPLAVGLAAPAHAQEQCGSDGKLKETPIQVGEIPNLLIDKPCRAEGRVYYFNHVNIVKGGSLTFIEPPIVSHDATTQNFWATSIIVENEGALLAGVDGEPAYGTKGNTLVIHLYGEDPRKGDPTANEGPGVSCVPIKDPANFADCGIPKTIWEDNGDTLVKMGGNAPDDFFYQYGNFHGDSGVNLDTGQKGHFGYKVLAVSYGGTLRLHGLKGTFGTTDADVATMLRNVEDIKPDERIQYEKTITSSGTDWGRLAKTSGTTLTLDRKVEGDWKPGDEVVVTSTDYLPEHSELRTIAETATAPAAADVPLREALTFPHSTTAYDVEDKVGTDATAFRTEVEKVDGANPPWLGKAETRAAVALLTRSIRIVSAGDKPDEKFPEPNPGGISYMYGGHVVFRQGFAKVQLQGVEFKQLGQGGLLGRYPVHFHEARNVPSDTYVIDCAINESMTRWIVIHSTNGVTVARNVGWKSIGHGYFLEDATETDNKFYSNIGIFARGSVVSDANPRKIPGLLDAENLPRTLPLKFHSDANYPSVFWITNGWNSFAGNMAAGAGTCGACYWYVPAGNHDMMDVGPNGLMSLEHPMKWKGYSQIQRPTTGNSGDSDRAGISPVKLFYKNACSSAMHSLSVTDETPCLQIEQGYIKAVENRRAPPATTVEGDPPPPEPVLSKEYYPRYAGGRKPAYCNPDAKEGPDMCTKAECNYSDPKECAPSVFSHYTSSFHWAGINFSAIWLRNSYILLDHAFLSDVQGAGVTVVTGGDYTRSNLPLGYWGLTTNSIFVGATDPDNKYAQAKGPNSACDYMGNLCLDRASGIGFPLDNFSTGQRLYNVYDGPAYEDANAFLDVHPSPCNEQNKTATGCMYYNVPGVRLAHAAMEPNILAGTGYLPNAAIAWKQSNGFFYPPAFHSANMLFRNVDIRHYVIEPLTFPGTYRTDTAEVKKQYAGTGGNTTVFLNWSDVDRQTELSDDDGSLTGLKSSITEGFKGSISVNEDPFFAQPVQTAECRSAPGVDASNACAKDPAPLEPPTARTSPYDHVTTVLYPADRDASWGADCTNQLCFGVPIYRQYLTGVKSENKADRSREWGKWQDNDCDKQMADLRGKSQPVVYYDPKFGPPPTSGTVRPVPVLPNDPAKRKLTEQFDKFQTDCPAPFVRMAGMALFQRSVLTVNQGKYFIDTTRSEEFQRGTADLDPQNTRAVNVFRPGKTYYVFFLYAKSTTKQTYQIYGGPNFTKADFEGVQMSIEQLPLKAEPWTMPWKVENDATPGVVDVTVDFTQIDSKDGNLDPKKLSDKADVKDETCHPHSYCMKSEGADPTCGCNTAKLGPLALLNPNYAKVCDNVCKTWAVRDIDCPNEGCFGFKFTLPTEGFEAKDQLVRPEPSEYPKDPWNGISLLRTGTAPDDASGSKDSCYYADGQIPTSKPGEKCQVRN
jgi:cell migration-inducing and hyaluronan-binding protein